MPFSDHSCPHFLDGFIALTFYLCHLVTIPVPIFWVDSQPLLYTCAIKQPFLSPFSVWIDSLTFYLCHLATILVPIFWVDSQIYFILVPLSDHSCPHFLGGFIGITVHLGPLTIPHLVTIPVPTSTSCVVLQPSLRVFSDRSCPHFHFLGGFTALTESVQ